MRLGPIVALVFSLLAAPAFAHEGQRLSLAAAEASKTLQSRLGEMAAAKTPLEVGKSPIAEPFGRVFDKTGLMALPPATSKDVPWLLEWLNATSSAYQAILLFGNDPKAPNEAVLVAHLQRNEREISLALEFMLLLMPRVTGTVVALLETLPESERNAPNRQAGLKQMGAGYMQTVSGSTQFLSGSPQPENARLIAAALRTTIGEWSKFATAENRTELLNLLAEARNTIKDDQVQADLMDVSSTLARAP